MQVRSERHHCGSGRVPGQFPELVEDRFICWRATIILSGVLPCEGMTCWLVRLTGQTSQAVIACFVDLCSPETYEAFTRSAQGLSGY